MDKDLETKIAILTTRMDYIVKAAADHEQRDQARFDTQDRHINTIGDRMEEIKSRLDKQNGTLPHMVEAMNILATSIEKLETKMAVIHTVAAENQWRTSLLWAFGGATITALIYALVRHFLP